MNYCPCWMCNNETDEEEVFEEDPDVLHDQMKEDE